MAHWDSGGGGGGVTEACINLKGDTKFQPIRSEYCPYVTITKNMA